MLARKHIVVAFTIVCLIPHFIQVYGQDKGELVMLESKLWKSPGDTIVGEINYVNLYNLQFIIAVSDTNNKSPKYYSPKDLSGFYCILNNERLIFQSMENPFDRGRVFLQLIYKGKYSAYLFLELDQRTSMFSFIPHYYLWNDVWLEPEISIPLEKEALLYHFSDCPELEFKIKTDEYGLKNIGEIIEEYHECDLVDEYEFFD